MICIQMWHDKRYIIKGKAIIHYSTHTVLAVVLLMLWRSTLIRLKNGLS